MKVETGFPQPIEGDYLLWSHRYPLPRFLRISKTKDETTCQLFWDVNILRYEDCVLVVRGFDLQIGYQVYPDQWDETQYIKLDKPNFLNIQSGGPTKPGRYYLYGSANIQTSLDFYYSHPENERTGLDYFDPGHYIEIIDYHGELALLAFGDIRPVKYNLKDFDKYFHTEIVLIGE